MWGSSIDGSCFTNFDKTYILTKPGVSFDLDDTLLSFKTGKILDNVRDTLLKLSKGYNIIIFSNQLWVSKGTKTNKEIQTKFNDLISLVKVPITVFYSTKRDEYRKPYIGMFELCSKLFCQIHNTFTIEFYCGDAAGRINDFSTSDLYFANNSNLLFKTPEEVFLNSKQPILACKNIKALELYKEDIWNNGLLENKREILTIKHINSSGHDITGKLGKKTLILMVGPPGSGKSSLASHYAFKYNMTMISRDIYPKLPYRNKLFDNYKNNDSNNGIIIDDLNNMEKKRNTWIDKVKDSKDWKVITVYINISKKESIHLSNYRFMFNKNKYIPTVVIHKYYKDLEPPNDSIVFCYAFTRYNFNHNVRFV